MSYAWLVSTAGQRSALDGGALDEGGKDGGEGDLLNIRVTTSPQSIKAASRDIFNIVGLDH